MIYTSYFAKVKKLPQNVVPISIAIKAPTGWNGLEFKALAPKWSFLSVWKQTQDNDYYIAEYQKQVLNQLNPEEVVKRLYALSYNHDVALICYEKSESFCHRHLVTDWLNSNGFQCVEWQNT
jgi:uncharacterized protein YeaO (DUF488 family)